MCVLTGVVSTGAQAAEPCPNEQFRTGLSANLPECRAYELVTPPYKDGAGPGPLLAVSPDGARAIEQSIGNYGDAEAAPSNEGSTYELTRTETGWTETGIDPPQSRFSYNIFRGASEDLNETLWEARASSQPIEARDLYIRYAGGALHDLGPMMNPEGTKGGLPGSGIPPGQHIFDTVYVGSSADFSHVLFWVASSESAREEAEAPLLWPGDTTPPGLPRLHSLYERDGDTGFEPTLVGVSNEGPLDGSPHINEGAVLISQCGTNLGSGITGATQYNAVSESGASVFFTAEHSAGCSGVQPPVSELYARLGGEKTLELSSPSHPLAQGDGSGPEECDSTCEAAAPEEGVFQSASRNGSKVFFLTKQPLLNGDEGGTGTGQDLYEDEIEGEGKAAKLARVVQISHDPHAGQAAEVQGVTRVSEDGSHVYFVAKGELAANSNGQAAPFSTAHDGAENLYVSEPDPADPSAHQTVFVAMLCSSAGKSGSVSDSECNSSDEQMWNANGRAPAQATPTGSFLVFSTATDLTAPEDTSTVGQVFRYDAQTGELARISIGQRGLYECPATKSVEEGFNCNGNTDMFEAGSNGGSIESPTPGRPVAISEDGSYVVFQSADGLTSGALNGQQESYTYEEVAENYEGTVTREQAYFANNVYEYHDGEVSLISDGLDTSASVFSHINLVETSSVYVEGMTPSGADIFFTTADRLVPQDTDTQQDIYDARIGGGFPPPPVPTPCQEEACQGPSAAAPSFGTPSSTTFSGAGNLAPPPATVPPKLKTAAQIKAEKLAKSLKNCRSDKSKKKRTACEKGARKKYGATKANKASTKRRAH
jgi:hypothetical protein